MRRKKTRKSKVNSTENVYQFTRRFHILNTIERSAHKRDILVLHTPVCTSLPPYISQELYVNRLMLAVSKLLSTDFLESIYG